MVIGCVILLLASLIYLLVGIYTQNELRQEQLLEVEAAKEELTEAELQFGNISAPIFDSIAKVFGQEYAAEVEEGAIVPGIPEEFLLLTLGDPAMVTSSYSRGRNMERWYYDAIGTGEEEIKYKTEIVIADNIITDIITD